MYLLARMMGCAAAFTIFRAERGRVYSFPATRKARVVAGALPRVRVARQVAERVTAALDLGGVVTHAVPLRTNRSPAGWEPTGVVAVPRVCKEITRSVFGIDRTDRSSSVDLGTGKDVRLQPR